ncbi:hypothetical protein LguiA_007448 [Lonicera macranthoides]
MRFIYKELKSDFLGFNILKSLDANVQHTQIWPTPPYEDVSYFVGRDGELSKIVAKICSTGENEKHFSVLAIVGMGGVGKTTLAQIICNHDKVVRHFDETIWIAVSKDFDVTRILNEMVQSLTGENPQLSIVDEIVKNELGGRLKGKRYLLVLDDIWIQDRDKWECLRKALLGIDGSRESKIMVTTRNDESLMQPSFICVLRLLSRAESWAIFKQRAFAKGRPTETQNMVDIGRNIVRSCGGLPLLIKAVGGLMYSKKSEIEWQKIKMKMKMTMRMRIRWPWYLNHMQNVPKALDICMSIYHHH